MTGQFSRAWRGQVFEGRAGDQKNFPAVMPVFPRSLYARAVGVATDVH